MMNCGTHGNVTGLKILEVYYQARAKRSLKTFAVFFFLYTR